MIYLGRVVIIRLIFSIDLMKLKNRDDPLLSNSGFNKT